MERREYGRLVVIAVLAGIVGGAVSSHMVTGDLAQAQSKAKDVTAEEFFLVDKAGKVRAGLGLDAKGEVGLILTSKDGAKKLYLSPDEASAMKLVDRNGKVLWAAP